MMVAPTPRDFWEAIPGWGRRAILLAILVLFVVCIIDPVLNLFFSPPKKEIHHVKTVPVKGKR